MVIGLGDILLEREEHYSKVAEAASLDLKTALTIGLSPEAVIDALIKERRAAMSASFWSGAVTGYKACLDLEEKEKEETCQQQNKD